ncbi:MAG: hypothetical protein WCD66_09830 [Rhodanobacteraceae bacterium]
MAHRPRAGAPEQVFVSPYARFYRPALYFRDSHYEEHPMRP